MSSARRLDVREDHARAYVDELGRRACVEPAPARRWVAWLAGVGLAIAATAIALVIVRAPAPHAIASEPVRVGDRVALVVAPGTSYRIGAAEPERTEVLVERGAVTARLWPGARSHALVLRGHEITARARHGVHALGRRDRRARRGPRGARRGAIRRSTRAGERRRDLARRPPAAARRGRARAARDERAAALPSHAGQRRCARDGGCRHGTRDRRCGARHDKAAPPGARPRLTRPPAPPHPAPADAAVPSPRERWRLARLLRGQGNYPAAIAHCEALADARDAVWSPIAIVEAARIELGPRTAPEAAIRWADRFAREWASHELAGEVRELRCRALRQLGRASECATP